MAVDGRFECINWFSMKLLSWNIRGMGKAEKLGRIKKLLKDRHIDVIFQETKKAVIFDIDVRRLWGSRNIEFMSVDSEGTTGGLLCIWDPAVFTLSGCCCNRSWSGFILYQKLKHLKLILKSWNIELFGNIHSKIKSLEEELHALDIIVEEKALVASEKSRRKVVRDEMWKLYRMIEWIWVKQQVLHHFKTQFIESWVKRPILGGVFNTIEADYVSQHLVAEFSATKVLAAIKDCNNNKAPGPDRFNLLCYWKFWKVMKPNIIQFFKEFHSNSRLTYGINNTFITLIPKLENPVGLSNYRPISLMGSIYKILAKVLSHRLKSVLSSIIGETQAAFIGGRNILDGVFIANKVVDGWKKAKKPGLILKLDFEKTYDSVN
ncbi:uncharacterized protein LOC114287789 [Camellia sinensis]|uniref:uncharacterized protein LOC114287789 n=1 Tax=Camellia sinensis TaxID=4442 RepID=UPI001036554D|nr:uncharacterized protein LOC114287789 [Camellia sinensis]